MCSSRPPSTWCHFSLKLGHVSVPQRLAGLVRTGQSGQVKGQRVGWCCIKSASQIKLDVDKLKSV